MWHGYMGWPSAAPPVESIKYICTGSEQGSQRHLGSCIYVIMLTMPCVSGIMEFSNILPDWVLVLWGTCMCWGSGLSAHGMDYIRNCQKPSKNLVSINPLHALNDSDFFKFILMARFALKLTST